MKRLTGLFVLLSVVLLPGVLYAEELPAASSEPSQQPVAEHALQTEEPDEPTVVPEVPSASEQTVEVTDAPAETPIIPLAAEEAEVASVVPLAADEASVVPQSDEDSYVNMYRLYNPNSGEHFYTGNAAEARNLAAIGWRWENVGWVAPAASDRPVYRLYNPNAGDHHYTTSAAERDHLTSLGWRYEGIGWYSAADDAIPVMRQYNPNAWTGTHNFTTSTSENDNLVSVGWHGEGVAWFAANHDPVATTGFWLVTSSWGSLERYWVDAQGALAHSRVINPANAADADAGYMAYATASGAVIRSVRDMGSGRIWFADNDGRLATASADGWWITGAYAGGVWQRYYIYAVEGGVAEARVGYSNDGYAHYTFTSLGYVARNRDLFCNGSWWNANNDGLLTPIAAKTWIDGYVNWAVGVANDNSHGYSQYRRWGGGDYDCSSLVISALRANGYNTGGASYTGDMLYNLRRNGWTTVAGGIPNLMRGDILLNIRNHTVIYIGEGKVVAARIAENGGIDGAPGDQTGTEIMVQDYYDYPWDVVLRYAR